MEPGIVATTDLSRGTGRPAGQKELEDEVIKAGLCTACGACVNICPYQSVYRDRTVTLHRCDLKVGRCYACCPRTPTDHEMIRKRLFKRSAWGRELGAVEGFYITRAADARIRERAQHGGTVTALVSLAFREGFIDAAVLTKDGEGLMPQSVTVDSPAAVEDAGGSRFVAAATVAEFNRASKLGYQRIGVVTTPCQALALAKMRTQTLEREKEMAQGLALVVGLFCGWALDWRGLRKLVAERTDPAAVEGMDIPPSRYHCLEVYTARGTHSVSLDEVTPIVRESCRFCDDMTAEYSDLSIGSARLPEGWQEARGWNQLIVRTERGRRLLDLARERHTLEFREVPEGNLEKLKTASLNKKLASERAVRSFLKEKAETG